jgi:hypothetical protein
MLDPKSRALARVAVVQAAGLLRDDITAFEVSCLFTKLLNDHAVNERALALGFVVDGETGLETAEMNVDYPDYVDIVRAMTPTERMELRARVTGR